MKTSEKTDKIFAAVFAAKKELVAVAKSSDNPFFKSKYADLNTHLDEVEPRLEKYGCMLLQPMNGNTVESIIIHVESQQWMSSEMSLIVAKNTMQDAGSAVTYARRYTLGALLAMKAEDDDGEKSMVRDSKPKYQPNPYVQQTPVKLNNIPAAPVLTTVTEVNNIEATPPKKSSSFKKKSTVPVTTEPVTLTAEVTLPPISVNKDGWQ